MKLNNFNTKYFLALLFLAGAGTAVVLWPFLSAILVAAILAALFHKPYQGILRVTGGRKGLSSSLVCLLVFFIIVIPFVAVVSLIAGEAQSAYRQTVGNPEGIARTIEQIESYTASIPLLRDANIGAVVSSSDIVKNIQGSGAVVLNILQKTYSGVTQFALWLFVMFFSLFYLFIDGKRLVNHLVRLSPLRDKEENLLIREFVSISRATLKGTIVVGMIQGAVGGALFAAVGVPSPATWGVVMAFFSIIPLAGSGFVWLPAAIIMLATGNVWQGITILAVGLGVISTIDNILRPKLVGRDSQMHPLLVFFSTLGGIFAFGIAGFLIGPIIAALFLALLQIYEDEFADELRKYNRSSEQ